MKVWIDLANSPHPLMFAPVARLLEAEGHEVLITVRDHAQTLPLARERWNDLAVVGSSSPAGRYAKARALSHRVAQLRRWARRHHPDVALSHNSYAQIMAAFSARIPAVTAMDFEYQPANHVAFRLAHTVLVPDVLPREVLHRQGASPRKLRTYSGLKEELYIGDFEFDVDILPKLGITARPRVLVVARTPPSRALYHRFGNPLFEEALRAICQQPDVMCVVLPRHPEQIAALEALKLPRCVVPPSAIDSRSLIYSADLMLGAGGTMTREAALMGIPTWSVFAGKPPAVDVWLERQRMLSHLTLPEQLAQLEPRPSPPRSPIDLRKRAQAVKRELIDATLQPGRGTDLITRAAG
jgi:predicted glycosyltransferase